MLKRTNLKEPKHSSYVQRLKVHQLNWLTIGKYHGPAGLLGLFENNKRLSLSCWIWSNFEDFCEEMIASECINVWMYECKINEYLWIPSSLAMHHKVPFDALNSFSYPTNYSNTEIKNYSNTEINESHPGLAASSLTVQWMFMHLHCIHANIWHIGLICFSWKLLEHWDRWILFKTFPCWIFNGLCTRSLHMVRILIVLPLPCSIRIQTTSIWLNLAASSIGRPPLS